MITLAIETATPYQTVALLQNQHILEFAECAPQGSLTQTLLPTIDRILEATSLTLADVNGLALSIGPGSFTGLRVGLATMTAFRLAHNLPLVGVSTLEGLAWTCGPQTMPMLCTVKIRQELVYWGLYEWQDGRVLCLEEEQMGNLPEICSNLSKPTLILGDGWVENRDQKLLNTGMLIEGPSETKMPSAKGIGWGGISLLKEKKHLPLGCTPHYIQPSYAERNSFTHPPKREEE